MFDRLSDRMRSRSAALLLTIDNRFDVILKYWLLVAGLASAARIASAPHRVPLAGFSIFASYMLLVVAPFASTLLALRWFSDGHLQPQPATRLARCGRWLRVSRNDGGTASTLRYNWDHGLSDRRGDAECSYPSGGVSCRDAADSGGSAPQWLAALHFAMTVDVVVFTSLYMIAFVAALRRVPLFPRLLLAIWLADLAMQLPTAQMVASTYVPGNVAVALQPLLIGNVKKVLISMALWLPYLLLSTRVNVTYRHRVPA